ncbi:MAG: PKD domain-containing protein [Bacteroidetes bacterium]|nr:MAG: PKD domain-containing protein [Bacteroidota bacterium]TAG86954.1 MAG: PKD domain-containing protein [Bacteroidota bacterium]
MTFKKVIFLFLFFVFFQQYTKAQVFGQPYIACPEQPITFTSPANSNLRHAWDFATGDLSATPQASVINNFMQFTWRPETIKILKDDDGNWYGFIVNVGGNTGGANILRVNFGNSLDNVPTYTPVGNYGCSSTVFGYHLEILRQNGNWYMFFSSYTGTIARYNLGTSLANLSSTSCTTVLTGLPPFYGCNVRFDDVTNKWFMMIPLENQATGMRVYDLGNSIENTPVFVRSIAGIGGFMNDFTKDENGHWHFPFSFPAAARRWGVARFGTSLDNVPIVDYYNGVGLPNPVPPSPANINFYYHKFFKDGLDWWAYAIDINGPIYRWKYGNSLYNRPTAIQNLTNFGILGNNAQPGAASLGFDLLKDDTNSSWYFFTINRNFLNYTLPSANVGRLIRLKFPNSLSSNPVVSDAKPSLDVRFETGKNIMELKVYNNDNRLINHYADSIRIKDAGVAKFILQNQCLGLTTNFVNLSYGNLNLVNQWIWDFGNGQTSSVPQPTYQYPQSGNYQVKLIANNNNGCSSTFTKNIRISKYPKADFRIKQLNCSLGTIDLEDVSTISNSEIADGAKIVQRIWSFGDGTYWQAAPINTTYIRKGNVTLPSVDGGSPFLANTMAFVSGQKYTISLTIVDDAGCSSTTSKEITMLNVDLPNVDFSFPLACVNVPLRFTDMSSLPTNTNGQINQWKWIFKTNLGVKLDSTTLQNPFYTFLTAGTYQVDLMVQNSNGCQNTITKTVVVNNSLTSLFQTNVNGGIAPLQVNFTNLTAGASSFHWDFGNGMISTQQNPIVSFTTPGTYLVRYQARNTQGCGTIATKNIIVGTPPTALEPLSAMGFKVSPNPFVDKITIEKNNSENAELVVLDLSGRELKTYLIDDNLKSDIFLDDLSNGMYLLKIRQKGKEFIQKIIKKGN